MSDKREVPQTDPASLPWLGRKLLWLDDMKNVNRIVYALYGLCAALFLADFFYKKKTYLDLEDIPGFYALYGFLMCAALVICARGMRLFLMRGEDYYAPRDVESETYPEHDMKGEEHDA
ncbi:MAG: hypothetical protein AAFN43_05835 [Pseudomonadota bacterium]